MSEASPQHEALRLRVATEEGVGDLADLVRGRTEDELRDCAIEIRIAAERDRPGQHPSLESAIAAQRRHQASLFARAWH